MKGTKIRLWKQTNKDGKTFLSGPMSKITRLVVIENDRKKDAKEPDSYAYIVPNRGPGQALTDLDEAR